MVAERKDTGQGLLVGAVGGTLLGVFSALLLAKPASGAMPDEKLDYLIDLLTALLPILATVAEGQNSLISLMEQWLAAQGIEPGVELTVNTIWKAKEPEELYDQPIRSVGTFVTDKMADWTQGKRLLLKVESSLDQACTIQLRGNMTDSGLLPINIGAPAACPANDNISISPAWDDWHPFIGAEIVTAIAPTTGMLKIWVVIQE